MGGALRRVLRTSPRASPCVVPRPGLALLPRRAHWRSRTAAVGLALPAAVRLDKAGCGARENGAEVGGRGSRKAAAVVPWARTYTLRRGRARSSRTPATESGSYVQSWLRAPDKSKSVL